MGDWSSTLMASGALIEDRPTTYRHGRAGPVGGPELRPPTRPRRTMPPVRRFGQGSLAWLGTAAVLSVAVLIPSGLQTAASAAPAPLITYIAGVGTTSATTAWLANANGSSPRELGPAATALLAPN